MRASIALLLLGALAGAQACVDVILKDNCTNNAVVSGRTLSFPTSLTPRLAWGAKGAVLPLLEVAPGVPSPLGRTYVVKNNFVTLHNARNEFKGLFPNDKAINNPKFLWSIDGMNDKGLSVAVLYQPESKNMDPYNPKSPKKDAINFFDMGTFALARFDRVAALKKYLDTGLQVVWSSTYDKFGYIISNKLGPKNPTLHMTFHDITGASVVLEWSPEGRMRALDNPMGVFTNDPLLGEQYKNYNGWMAKMLTVPSGAVGKGVWNPPGDYSGRSRWTRLAMVKQAALGQCWNNRSIIWDEYEVLNPGYVTPQMPKSNPTIMAVMGMLNTVYLPRGMTDTGHREVAAKMSEFTPFSSIRDHRAKVFYYRSANNPHYKAIDMNKVRWGTIRGGITSIPMQNPAELWFKDYSNEFKAPPTPLADMG